MANQIFRAFINLSPIKFILLALVITQACRIALVVFFTERIAGGEQIITILINGLRIDIALLCLWLSPVLLVNIISLAFPKYFIWQVQRIGKIWMMLGLIGLVFMEAATPTFISEFDIRPNRLFVEYLNSPKEVGGMLIKGFGWQVGLGLFITSALSFFLYRILFSNSRAKFQQTKYWRIKRLAVFTVAIPIIILGARSGLQHRPINPAMVSVGPDRLVNSLSLNSFYSVLYAAYEILGDKGSSVSYGEMPIETAYQLIRSDMNRDSDFIGSTTHHTPLPTGGDQEKDLLVIVLESHGAHFVESLGGESASPNIEAWRQKSWFFDELYATGIRSARGLGAIIAGYPPTPAQAIIKRSKAQENFTTIASILKREGYFTEFIYGGESHFDNMKGFFLSNGFNSVVDQYDYVNPKFKGSWGVSDEDLFDKVYASLEQPSERKRFTLAFTSSNHPPFEYPKNTIKPIGDNPATATNSAHYADYALGKFLKKLEETGFLDRLVVLVIADHEDKVYGERPVPFEKFRIPGFIISPSESPRIDQRIVSQIDMAPTLLSLLGVKATTPMIGRDLTKDNFGNGRAILQFGENAAYMTKHGICYLQPEKKSFFETFSSHAEGAASTNQCEKALAYQIWANHTYDNTKYNTHQNTIHPAKEAVTLK